MQNLFPVNLNLDGRKCLVVGGGRVAERKVRSLLQYGADIWIVSPELTAELSTLAAKGMVMTDDNPDFLIDLRVLSKFQEFTVQRGFGSANVSANFEGKINLDFKDAETDELFWHGEATGSLKPNLTPEKQEREYAKIAARLLKKFPPGK